MVIFWTSMPRNTYGDTVKKRVKRLLEALLAFVNWEFESNFDIEFKWEAKESTSPKVIFKTTLVALEQLITKDKYPGKLKKEQIREALKLLENFLKILKDNRTKTKGSDDWHFTLTLWSKDKENNLKQFDQAWEESRPEKSKALEANFKKSDAFDWRNICLAMLEGEKPLTTNELMRDEDDRFELEEIHVPLALVERKKPDRRGEEILPEQGSRLYEPEYEEKQRFEHEQFLLDILTDGKGKQNGKRIAIIGEPGAGKTTLLRKIAVWVQENTEILPISISLADLPETNSQQQFLEQYLLDKWLPAALPYFSPEMVEVTEALKTELKKLCNQGRVWLLLDGVDEMPVQGEERLGAISNQLKGWVGQARVVLTCRLNVWEANRNVLADNFEIYRTLEFSYGDSTTPDRVEEFIAKWFNKQPNLGQQLRQELDKPGKERIKDLVKNPLRLSLLCSTWNWWRDRGGLPDTKAKLYQGFVEKFYDWKGKEFPTNYTQREKLNRALGELAKLAIDQTTSRFRLKHSWVCEVWGKPDEGLFELALQLGWLNKVGLAAESPDETVYAFWHPTFEEYFAALAIDDWDFFLNHVPDNPKQGIYRIFEKQWKEVILLWLGREEERLREQKEEFINALVNFEDGCGCFYNYQAFLMAAKGIAEFKNYDSALEIIKQIVHWSFGYLSGELNQWLTDVYPQIRDAAKQILREINHSLVIAQLINLLNTPNEYICIEVADSLGKVVPGHPKAVESLINLIKTCSIPGVRMKAVIVLANIGKDHQETITHLVELIHNSPDDPLVRSIAAQCVGKIDPNHPDAILLTVTIVPNSFEESSESKKMETNYEDKIKSLISQICTTSDEPINFEVIQDLRHIIKLHLKSAVSALKEALPVQLNDEKDFKLHQICWEFLWQCSENLSYPDFYQAWHPDTLTNSATTSLNLANLPQDIADTINN
jgi:energy-coupling factor transporter ATP-binding protein EcfA2